MQTVLIIGAGAGISGAVARRFGREGYKIGLVARSASALELQSNKLTAAGMAACFETADAGDLPRLQYAIERLTEQLGPIDVLIYNASVMRPASPLELSTEQLSHEFSVNLLGAFQAAQQVAPSMIKRGFGAILFTGGGLALEPYPEWTSLALGKAALRSLSLSLYKELSPKGVHVSVLAVCGIVEPGGPFDPDIIAAEYYRVATAPKGIEDREVIIQPDGTDVFYNDPDRRHAGTTLPPSHVRETVKP
ncbi:SDR family oxidoreductase [Roseibium sp.]|uniref:SDR family oxidoreductase n=1 Tax=Roseibium sp. TaxID=1936156 RepID=UPI003B5186B7